MMEAVHTSETLVHFVTTRRYIPEDSKLKKDAWKPTSVTSVLCELYDENKPY
jgi:hypothetical protein